MSTSDGSLLERWTARRDAEAFQEIVERHSRMIYGTCCRILGNATEAEDATQECFESLVRAKLTPRDYLAPWLHRVATNLCLKRVRTRQRRAKRERDFGAKQSSQTQPSWDDIYSYVDEAMADLPEEFRVPVVAHFLGGQTHEAIAKDLGLSRSTVTYRIGRGLRLLGRFLKRRGVGIASAVLPPLLVANLAQAAPLPPSLVAGLGKLALAQAGESVLPIGVEIVGGLLAMKKAILGAAVLMAVMFGLWMLRNESQETRDDRRTVVSASMPQKASPDVRPAPMDEVAKNVASREGYEGPPEPSNASLRQDTLKAQGICTLSGEVVNEAGALVSGASVVLQIAKWYEHHEGYDTVKSIPPSGLSRVIASDEEGHFGFARIPMGDYFVLALAEDGFGVCKGVVREKNHPERVIVRLQSAGSISGTVRDSAGAFISGARIVPLTCADREFSLPSHVLPPLSVTTRASGDFTLGHLWPGDWRLAVSAPDYADLITGPIATGTRNVSLVMSEGATVSGEVTKLGNGAPVPGAVVTLKPLVGTKEYECVSDQQGRFTMVQLPEVNYTASVTHVALLMHEGPTAIDLSQIQKVEDVRFRMGNGGGISGRVFDDDTGEGIEGVAVSAGAAQGDSTKTSRTDARGEYRMAGLPRGRHHVRFGEVKGYPYDRFERGFSELKVMVEIGQEVGGIDFPLTKGGRVSGKVVNSAGNAVAGALVEGVSRGARRVNEYAVSQEDGSFELTGFPVAKDTGSERAGAPLFLRARVKGQGLMSEQMGPITLTADGVTGIILVISEAGTISGRVFDKMGRPMAGAKVVGHPATSLNFSYPGATTDIAGSFVLTEVEPATYGLRVSPFGTTKYSGDLERVSVKEGRTVDGVRVIYSEGLSISGIVTNDTGETVAAHVEVHHQDFTSPGSLTACGRGGAFEAAGLTEGAHRIRAFADGYAPNVIEGIAAGTSDLLLTLTRAARLEGHVAVTDQSATPVEVEVRYREGSYETVKKVAVDTGSCYSIDGLPSGEVAVTAFFYGPNDELQYEEQAALLDPGMVTDVNFSFGESN